LGANLKIRENYLIRNILKYVAPRSFLAIAVLSAFSLAGFIFNYKHGFSESARTSYQWVVYLQAIAGFVQTFFSTSFQKKNIDKFVWQENLIYINLCQIISLLGLLFFTEFLGVIAASLYIGITNSLFILEGSQFLQLPIYVLLSLGTSFQLFLSPIAGSLECVRVSEAMVLLLFLANLRKLKINPYMLFKSVSSLPLPMLLRSFCLASVSAFNGVIPILYLGVGQLSKILNIMLRATFTVEGIFLSRIQHSGKISIAHEAQGSFAYYLMCLSLVAVNLSISLFVYLFGGFESFDASWNWGMLSFSIYLALISSSVGGSRLLYAFSYYKEVHSTYISNLSPDQFFSRSQLPRIRFSIAFLVLIFCCLLVPIWLSGFGLLLVPPLLFLCAALYVSSSRLLSVDH
jgi:hypothetical protein